MHNLNAINFTYDSIKVISEKQFMVHMELYKGYVNKINEIWEKLSEDANRDEANATYSYYRGLKKGETYALDGVILHELYFANIGGDNKSPGEHTAMLLEKHFGSLENWVRDFIACGKAARGWAMLAYDQRSKKLCNFLLDAHDEGVIVNAYPILIMDVYEHAYYIDYANKKDEYINNFMKDINWDVVNMRAMVLK
ncbi:MAG: superoxide dismutase [Bacillota bacterium]